MPDSVPGNTSTTETLTPGGGAVSGEIDTSYDRDWYAVTLTAGVEYNFFTGPGLNGNAMDTTINLRDVLGHYLRYDDDSGPGHLSQLLYTPTTSGTYYVDVGGWSSSTGSFSVQVDVEDFGGNAATAGSLEVDGEVVQGVIAGSTDHDWFSVSLDPGQMYVMGTRVPLAGPRVNTNLTLWRGGTAVGYNDDYLGQYSRIVYVSRFAGTSHLDVAGHWGETGNYGIAVVAMPDTVGGDATSAESLSIGVGGVTGFVENSSDHDWYAVTLEAGQRYFFYTSEGVDAVGADTVLTLRSSAGTSLQASNDYNGQYSRIAFTATSAGTYYLDVSSNGNAVGSYTLVAANDAIPGNANTTVTLPIGNAGVSSTIDISGDHDWFAIDLVAGRTYYFRMQNTTGQPGMSTSLILRDSDGTELFYSNKSNYEQSSAAAYTAATSGTYYLDITGYQNATGHYTLVASEDTAGHTSATAGRIGIGGSNAVEGTIDGLYDQDWYGVRLEAGQTYYIFTREPAEGTAVDTTLTLRSANGAGLAQNYDFRGNFSQIAFTPTTTRMYYIDVGGEYPSTGGYGLVVLQENDAVAANLGTAGTLAVGADATEGVIDRAGDHDWYAVTLTAGQSYAFTVEDPASGAAVDSTLAIRDASGLQLYYREDISNTDNHGRILFTAPTDGTYYIDVGAERTLVGDYALRAETIADTLGQSAATAGAVTIGGAAVNGALNTFNDHDWFAVTAEAGHSYLFTLALPGGAYGLQAVMRAADGSQIAARTFTAYIWNGSRYVYHLNVEFSPTEDGTYYLDFGTNNYLSTYSLTAREEGALLPPSTATSGVVTIDAPPVQGLFDWNGDHDWYAVTLEAGQSYVIRSEAVGISSFAYPIFDLRDADGNYLGGNAYYGQPLFFTAANSGTYYLNLFASYGTTGNYQISAVQESIRGNVTTTATLPTDGTPSLSTIDGIADHDWFAVSLTAGETYYIYTGLTADGYGGSTELALRSADGSLLAQNDDFGGSSSSRIVFTAATSGTYYVDVGGEGNYYTTNYSVAAAHDAVGSVAADAGALAMGGLVQSRIDGPQDRDWFAVSLTAGESYYFYTQAPDTGTGVDTRLVLRDGSGTQLSVNDDREGTDSVIRFTAASDGTYYLDVSGAGTFATGGYGVGAVVVTTLDRHPSNATTSAAVIVNGNARQGVIDYPTDHDWLRVTLVAGETYRFSTGAPASGSGVDTVMTLRSPSGTVIASNDDAIGTNSALVFTAAADGVYFLDVASAAGATGGYSVQAETMSVLNPTEIAARIAANNGTPHRFAVAAGDTLTVNLTGLTAEGQALARGALTLWSDASGLAFAETSGSAAITFDDAAAGVLNTWTEAGGVIVSAAVNVGLDVLAAGGTGPASASMQSYLAAIGLALGLGTPGAYAANPTYPGDAAFANDGWASSVLSAFDSNANTFFAGLGYTVQPTIAPTAADIIAIQQLYGPVTDLRIGDTVYGFGHTSGLAIHDAVQFRGAAVTIADGGGIDTLDLSGYADSCDQVVDLRPQHLSSTGGSTGNLWIARGTRIENALTGLGNDVIYGNNLANTLSGGAGDDRIYGAQEADTISGGAGNDIVAGGSENDALGGNAGNDIVIGGTGRDFCSGNSGADVFRFSEGDFGGSTTASADVIFDFSKAEFDRIDLRRVDAASGGIDQAFSFIATAAFSGVAGQLRYELVDGNTYVSGDTDGDGAANFMVRLNGEITLVAADFVL